MQYETNLVDILLTFLTLMTPPVPTEFTQKPAPPHSGHKFKFLCKIGFFPKKFKKMF